MHVQAWEWGIALGLVLGLAILVLPSGMDDFSTVFWPAGRMRDPYQIGLYFYPVWNTWLLRFLALYPREFALCFIWACNVVFMATLSPVWGTAPWVALLAPPFLAGMFYGHPFETVVFLGVTTLWLGWYYKKPALMGVGLALCLFKLQLGFLPALVGAYHVASTGRGRRLVWGIPIGLVCLATLLEWIIYGVAWMGPWWERIQQVPTLTMVWNASLAQGFSVFSWLWLPIGLWLLSNVQDFQRRLWVAMALGLLVSPYWAAYSLYPLVAMAGCWRGQDATQKAGKAALQMGDGSERAAGPLSLF